MTTGEDDLITAAFHDAGLDAAAFTLHRKPGPATPLRRFVSAGPMLTVAVNQQGRDQNRIEVAGRSWASSLGVPVPRVLAAAEDGGWILSDAVRVGVPEGPDYVAAGMRCADAIAAGRLPQLPVAGRQWRGSRRDLLARATRVTLGGVSPRQFRSARAAAAELPCDTPCHGDFYRRNVLPDADAGGVAIVDWEFLGMAARYTDQLRFLTTLRRAEDRQLAWQLLQQTVPARDHEHLATLLDWLSLRLLGENLAAPRAQRNAADLRHARTMRQEARRLIASLR